MGRNRPQCRESRRSDRPARAEGYGRGERDERPRGHCAVCGKPLKKAQDPVDPQFCGSHDEADLRAQERAASMSREEQGHFQQTEPRPY